MWTSKIKPRGWQVEALNLWKKDKKGVVRVVTGGGKTIFSQFCIDAYLTDFPDGRIIIIVPTTALLDQWVVSINEDFGLSSEYIACFSADEKPDSPKLINILVINTARHLVSQLSKGSKAMLIVDECHRSGSAENARALMGEFEATLGLSATPEREYDDGFDQFVKPTLGPIIYDYGYLDAAKDRVISPFALHNIRVEMLSDEQKSFDLLTRRIASERAKIAKGGGSDDKIKRILQQRAAVLASVTMRIPVAVKLAEQHIGLRTIIFHERLDAANKLLSILKARGRSVTIYHSGISPILRRDNLRLYRKGVFDILICCRALDEGINVPETAVAIIASSTASIRQRVQRLGRVLRPALGKEFAEIYTIYASDVEESRLMAEAESFGEICKISWLSVER